jgi:hypothetical protein
MDPEPSNLLISVAMFTDRSREQLVKLFELPEWKVRKCAWDEFEIKSSWAEVVVEAENPVLMHGLIRDGQGNIDRILQPLREAEIAYKAEVYGENHALLHDVSWAPT